MGDITENLSRHEFKCKCCDLADPHPVLCLAIQEAVDKSGASSIWITSGSRCKNRNRALEKTRSAAPGSKHLPDIDRGNYTLAADCIFRDVSLLKVLQVVQNIAAFKNGGIGLYVDDRLGEVYRLHLDVRGYKARWAYVDGSKVNFNIAVNELQTRTV